MLDPGQKQSIFQSLKLKDESKKQSLGSNSSLSEDDEDDDEDDSRIWDDTSEIWGLVFSILRFNVGRDCK